MMLKVNRKKTLEVARKYAAQKIREKTRNWDGGGFITQALATCGIDYPAPWCAAACALILKEANGDYPWRGIATPAYVPAIAQWAKANGIYRPKSEYVPQPGDIVIFGKGPDHIGIVDGVDRMILSTIEGNTGPADQSADGDGLYRKPHKLTSDWVRGFIAWPDVKAVDPENVTVLHAGRVLTVGRIEQGRTVAAIAPILDALGYRVVFDAKGRTASIELKGK